VLKCEGHSGIETVDATEKDFKVRIAPKSNITGTLILVAVLIELRRGGGVHPVYRWGLPISVAAQAGVLFLTPTGVGQALSGGLAWLGVILAPLY
jgi:hypothetical protein